MNFANLRSGIIERKFLKYHQKYRTWEFSTEKNPPVAVPTHLLDYLARCHGEVSICVPPWSPSALTPPRLL